MMNENMFANCETLEDGKAVYRNLSKEYHPDHGGNEELMKELNNQYDSFLASFIAGRVSDFLKDKDFDINSEPFSDVLKTVIHFNMNIEVIGFWIYCFNGYDYRVKLSDLGFWFSRKHKAWIFSGSKKRNIRSKNTTNINRDNWGSNVVREKEELAAIA